jgi:multisubunit Na+/H+ antiporter MnhC subunit
VAIGLGLGRGLLATGDGERAKREPFDAPIPQALTNTSIVVRAASLPILEG